MPRGRQPNLYLQFLLLVFAGWINRQQQAVIEYLRAENQSLREQLDNAFAGRTRSVDGSQKKAKAIGRSALVALGDGYAQHAENVCHESFRSGSDT